MKKMYFDKPVPGLQYYSYGFTQIIKSEPLLMKSAIAVITGFTAVACLKFGFK